MMYVEVAEIDAGGGRSTVHSFEGVVELAKERGNPEEYGTSKVHISLENGTETVIGRGYGLDVVRVEQE